MCCVCATCLPQLLCSPELAAKLTDIECFDVDLGDWFDQLAGTSTGGLLALYCKSCGELATSWWVIMGHAASHTHLRRHLVQAVCWATEADGGEGHQQQAALVPACAYFEAERLSSRRHDSYLVKVCLYVGRSNICRLIAQGCDLRPPVRALCPVLLAPP
jgi:hypothetical protein